MPHDSTYTKYLGSVEGKFSSDTESRRVVPKVWKCVNTATEFQSEKNESVPESCAQLLCSIVNVFNATKYT